MLRLQFYCVYRNQQIQHGKPAQEVNCQDHHLEEVPGVECSCPEPMLARLALAPVQALVLPQFPFHALAQNVPFLSLWRVAPYLIQSQDLQHCLCIMTVLRRLPVAGIDIVTAPSARLQESFKSPDRTTTLQI